MLCTAFNLLLILKLGSYFKKNHHLTWGNCWNQANWFKLTTKTCISENQSNFLFLPSTFALIEARFKRPWRMYGILGTCFSHSLEQIRTQWRQSDSTIKLQSWLIIYFQSSPKKSKPVSTTNELIVIAVGLSYHDLPY